MKKGRNWLHRLLPLLVMASVGFAQNSFAQDDYPPTTDNNGNYDNTYDNSDQDLISPEQDVDYNTFHDELSPYGNWMNYPGYGNVWVCNVPNFRPYYSDGHWAYTRFGWTWVSDYNWGWAPFHYGRWSFDNAYGWFWVPGYTWGPAWVSWRNGGDYYGWAPLSPGLSVGLNIGIGIPTANWVFMPHRYMGYRSINPYFVNRQQNVTIIRNTTIINNTNVYNNNRFVVGPNRRDVERYTRQRIQPQNIYVSNQRNTNGQDRNGIHFYNPNANRGAANNGRIERNDRNNNQQFPQRQPNNQNGVQPNNGQQNDRTNPAQGGWQQRGQNMQNGNNQLQNDQQRQQRMQDMQNRMQQNNDTRRQQMDQMRQQQTNDRQNQMMQQQQRQQQDVQRQQMMQQRQQQNNDRQQQFQQRQQMQQQRQQQFQQQRMNSGGSNRPIQQRSNNGGKRN